jgi:hypothetical protein
MQHLPQTHQLSRACQSREIQFQYLYNVSHIAFPGEHTTRPNDILGYCITEFCCQVNLGYVVDARLCSQRILQFWNRRRTCRDASLFLGW